MLDGNVKTLTNGKYIKGVSAVNSAFFPFFIVCYASAYEVILILREKWLIISNTQ